MTYREYIEKLLEIIKGEDILSCDPRTVLPRPEENDNGMLAAFMAASDPHFIAARKQNPFWYIRAQQELEKFAKQVGSMLNPDSESITEEVMRFLEDFLARNLEMKALDKEREEEKDEEEGVEEFEGEEGDDEEENGDDGETDDEPEKVQDDSASGQGLGIGSNAGEGEQPGESSIDDLLDGLFPQPESSSMKEDDSKQDKDKTNSKKGDDNPENNEEVDDEEQSNTGFSLEDSHSDDEIEDGFIGSGNSKNENRRRENIFLRSIPKGLFELAKLIGRSGSVGFKPSGSFPSASKSDITGITIGDNLSSILPSETAMLSCPATQTVFFRNFVEKRLQIFASASSGQEPIEHQDGPVIICLDTSASMMGEKIKTACKLTLAITIIAQRRHRNVLVIMYSDRHYLYKVTNMARDKDELLKFLTRHGGMGNSENEMFRWLFYDVLPIEPDFDSADILCVTDFGWERLYGGILERIEQAKREGMKFYGLNICDEEDPWEFLDYCDQVMSVVCDSLWTYHKGKCWEVPIPKAGGGKTAKNKTVVEGEKRHRSKAPKRKKIGFL